MKPTIIMTRGKIKQTEPLYKHLSVEKKMEIGRPFFELVIHKSVIHSYTIALYSAQNAVRDKERILKTRNVQKYETLLESIKERFPQLPIRCLTEKQVPVPQFSYLEIRKLISFYE